MVYMHEGLLMTIITSMCDFLQVAKSQVLEKHLKTKQKEPQRRQGGPAFAGT